jgi:hypothetical protein
LPNWYAQAHPDEDFAETFAVWLSEPKFATSHAKWNDAYRKPWVSRTAPPPSFPKR